MTGDNNREEALRLAVLQRPENMEQRAQLAELLAASGRRAEALSVLNEGQVFAHGREDRLEQLAEALLAIDALPEALEVLQAACRICPGDERLKDRVISLSRELNENATATRQLFNQYAASFETELAALNYTVPDQIAAMLAPYRDRFSGAPVLDLGCGTGLMGVRLRDYASKLVGVDLSPAMIEESATKNLYDELITGDIVDYCQHSFTQFALVTAADVLVYIGDLAPLFGVVKKCLIPDGLFAFTVERFEGDGYVTKDTRRVSHSALYIKQQAETAGFSVTVCEPITPRHDRGKPVDGLMVLLTANP